jgi:DNA-binding MarR family transcriptional regulator
VDQASQRDLRILTAIAEQRDVTQRGLAKSLGIALGLANLYMKRLSRKGYIKVSTIPARRVRYLLTPRGLAEKTRLTYEYMAFSLRLYRDARTHLREAVRPLVEQGVCRFALYGTGEAAELAYLALREFGLEPVAIYGDGGPDGFLGFPVRPIEEMRDAPEARVIVAVFDAPQRYRAMLAGAGVDAERLMFLDGGTGGES